MPLPRSNSTGRPDWTAGPAKHAAAALLGIAATVGIGWSVVAGRDRPIVLTPGPEAVPRAHGGADPDPTTRPPAPLARRVNINIATTAELEMLPGIGPALARRIIEDRDAHGPFQTLDALDRVKGIGPRTIDRLRGLASVE